MTRIDIVPVEEMHKKHVVSGIHEITRVLTLVKKAQKAGVNKYNFHTIRKVPREYTLGTGHVLFFYDKLKFIVDRYELLCNELERRGGKPNRIPRENLIAGINKSWYNDYTPSEIALQINRERINARVNSWKDRPPRVKRSKKQKEQ